jgi:flagellar motor switch protein FliN/FliY
LHEASNGVADESKSLRQDEVEQLLSEARQAQGAASAAPAAPASAPPPAEEAVGPVDQSAIEAILSQSPSGRPAAPKANGPSAESEMEGLIDGAQQALASVDELSAALPPGVKPFELRTLTGKTASSDAATLDLLRDVQLDLKIELGRTHMQLDEVLQLKKGAVVTLDKLAGDPVDIFVNGRLIARGEVLVLNDNFCVRVAELVAGENALA